MTTISGKEFNDKYSNTVFYTVLRTNRQFNKMPLIYGLNILAISNKIYERNKALYFYKLNKLHLLNKNNIVTVTILRCICLYWFRKTIF